MIGYIILHTLISKYRGHNQPNLISKLPIVLCEEIDPLSCVVTIILNWYESMSKDYLKSSTILLLVNMTP